MGVGSRGWHPAVIVATRDKQGHWTHAASSTLGNTPTQSFRQGNPGSANTIEAASVDEKRGCLMFRPKNGIVVYFLGSISLVLCGCGGGAGGGPPPSSFQLSVQSPVLAQERSTAILRGSIAERHAALPLLAGAK